MGYFSISSKRDADPTPLESRVLISDKDIGRITAAYARIYFPNGVEEGGVTRSPTGQEVFNAVAGGLLQDVLTNTINQEKGLAAAEAQDAVPPIPIKPGLAE